MDTGRKDRSSAPQPGSNPEPFIYPKPQPNQVFIMTRKFSTLDIPKQPDLIDVYSTVDKALAAMRAGVAAYNSDKAEAENLKPIVYRNRRSGNYWAYLRYEDQQLRNMYTVTIGAYGVDGTPVTASGTVGEARAEPAEIF